VLRTARASADDPVSRSMWRVTASLLLATTAQRWASAISALPEHLAAAREEIAAGTALLVDVREPEEWAGAHLASATHAPLSALQRGDAPDAVLDAADKRIYLHCAAGIRVHPAKACLSQLGCDDIVALKEGIGELYQLEFDALAEKG